MALLLPLLALLFSLLQPRSAQAVVITNNVSVSSNFGVFTAKNAIQAAIRTPSQVEFLQYAPGAPGSAPVTVPRASFSDNGAATGDFATTGPITTWDSNSIALPSSVDLLPTTAYHGGEPIFVRLTDLDQNLDPEVSETVLVYLTSLETGDSVLLRLTETGPDTGVFVGAVQSTSGPVTVNDRFLSVGIDEHLQVGYTDRSDARDTSKDEVMIDPYGLVFRTSDGAPVNGATVTLWDVLANAPATVYHDDGSPGFPATVTSGDPAFGFPDGEFRFPFVRPGTYRLQVVPPVGYGAPSTVPLAVIQALPGNPFSLVNGSRGEDFIINPGPALHLDLPVDYHGSGLFISKKALKALVAVGEFIQYSLTIGNTGLTSLAEVTVHDRLPVGFRYESGSATLDGKPLADPLVSADGRTLTFALGLLPAASNQELRYVTGVTVGAKPGIAVNSATAEALGNIHANTAQAQVMVEDDLFGARSLVMGRVMLGNCPPLPPPVGTVGLQLTSRVESGSIAYSAGINVAKLPVEKLVLVVELPKVLNYRLGSASLDGQPLTDPEVVEGALRFLLNQAMADSHATLNFIADPDSPAFDEYTTLAHLEFADPDALSRPANLPLRTPGAPNRLQIAASEGDGDFSMVVSKGDSGEKRAPSIGLSSGAGAVGIGLDTPGLNKVRLVMEDGRYVETDSKGNYHFEGLEPGSHVLQVDLASLPSGMEIFQCEQNSRFAGVAHSTFVDLQPGSLWRADFSARSKTPGRKPGVAINLTTTPGFEISEVILKVELSGGQMEMRKLRLYVTLPEGLRYLPGSATLAGEPLPDPENGPEGLLFAIGDRTPDSWQDEITFKAEITDNNQGRDYTSRAFLRYEKVREVEPPAVPTPAAPTPALSTPDSQSSQPAQTDGILSLKEGQRLATRIHAIPVRLDARLKAELKVDGRLLGNDRIGMQLNEKGTGRKVISYVGIDLGEPGPHILSLQGNDPFGNARFKQEIHYIRTSEIAAIKVLEVSGNLADGKTPVRIKLELRDLAGELITGESLLTLRDGDLTPLRRDGDSLPELREGAAITVDSQGYANFAPVSNSGTHTATLAYGEVTAQIRTYVKPQYREWIMVGLAEGTAGYNRLSGNLENLAAADQEEGYYREGRLAFYAKGKVLGKYLLTAAYDSARERNDLDNGLFGAIDPNKYYTLYGDKSLGGHDAASKDKLYLKLDGDQFYALYGDYDTGLSVTELSRYSRTLTGFKGEYHGDKITATAFAAESNHAFLKDELPGDGTSGLYHLSHPAILLNSEKISIETRDRFHSEVVLKKRQLSRFIDYTFDAQDGSIYFREPIFSRDDEFNPTYIVAEYEVASGATSELSGGGRVAYPLGAKDSEAGLSLIHEATPGARADLQGVDLKYAVNDTTSIKAEAATTTKTVGGDELSGNAFLLEISRHDQQLNSKAYFRQQDSEFGLGQQAGSEAGTRKYGADGRYNLSKQIDLNGEIFRQETLTTGALRDAAAALLTYKLDKFIGSGGLRWVRDEDGGGTIRTSTLVTAAMKQSFLADDRLALSINGELAVAKDESGDYPNRLVVGGEYTLTQETQIFAAHEMTFGAKQDSQSSRVGFKATPWTEGVFHSSLEDQSNEAGVRTFASTALTQGWQYNEALHLDFGLERSQTLRHPGDTPQNVNVPPASGAITDDFTAISSGATYREELWSMTGRAEYRDGEQENKALLLWGFYHEETPGFGFSSVFRYFDTDLANGSRNSKGELEFSVARRPLDSQWIIIDKARLEEQKDRGPDLSSRTRKVVNNLNANYLYDRQNQVSLNHGIKYVTDNFDGAEYNGITQLLAVEYRHDLNKEWDLGVQSATHFTSVGSNALYSGGVSVGHSFAKNIWLSVGYNLSGFRDDDFSGADYTAQGVYMKCRAKFVKFDRFLADPAARQRYWARAYVGWARIARARPNAGHTALARLGEAGRMTGILTQNVDGLHAAAGSDAIELHGSLHQVICLGCGRLSARAALQAALAEANPGWALVAAEVAPDGDAELPDALVGRFRVEDCAACGGALKPAVVMFGEAVPRPRVEAGFAAVDAAEALLVIGSSLTVFSGLRFVRRAAERGIPVAIVNLGPTRGDDRAALTVDGRAGEVLPALAAHLTGEPA